MLPAVEVPSSVAAPGVSTHTPSCTVARVPYMMAKRCTDKHVRMHVPNMRTCICMCVCGYACMALCMRKCRRTGGASEWHQAK